MSVAVYDRGYMARAASGEHSLWSTGMEKMRLTSRWICPEAVKMARCSTVMKVHLKTSYLRRSCENAGRNLLLNRCRGVISKAVPAVPAVHGAADLVVREWVGGTTCRIRAGRELRCKARPLLLQLHFVVPRWLEVV